MHRAAMRATLRAAQRPWARSAASSVAVYQYQGVKYAHFVAGAAVLGSTGLMINSTECKQQANLAKKYKYVIVGGGLPQADSPAPLH